MVCIFLLVLLLRGEEVITVKHQRQRYIGFYIQLSNQKIRVLRSEIISAMRKQVTAQGTKTMQEMGLRLLLFDGTYGILKCYHNEKDRAIQLLENIQIIASHKATVVTIATSGTIRALKNKMPMNKTAP